MSSTAVQLFSHPIQFLEETTEGTTPATGAWTAVGASSTLSIDIDGQHVDISQIGPEDIHSIASGQPQWETKMTYQMVDSSFAKYAVKAANFVTPTGTISKTLSVFFGIYLSGTINYIVLKGSRAKQISMTVEDGKPTVCTIDFVHTSIAIPSTSVPGGTKVTAFPSGAVFDWLSGGADPLSWNGVAQKATRFSITINRNTTVDFVLGTQTGFGSQPHGRRISGDFTVLWISNTLETEFQQNQTRTLVMTLSTSPASALTVQSVKIVRHSKEYDGDSTEALVEVCAYRGRAVDLT